MKNRSIYRRTSILFVAFALTLAMTLPVSASMLSTEAATQITVSNFSKNGTVAEIIHFSADDFRVVNGEQDTLDSVLLTSLPAQEAGQLMIGNVLLTSGDLITVDAMAGLRFTPSAAPTVASTSFTFVPVFKDGTSGNETNVNLYLLTAKNSAPVAENLDFTTYKNVAYTGMFSGVDPEGDLLTFQLVDKPARGAIEIKETGEFVYTPYENKTGKDSFTYVASDTFGNTSEQATVKIKIEKPATKVTYADMNGHPAYNAAIRLAEEGIYIGASMDDAYYFQPDLPVTRSEFLTLAMAATNLDALEGIRTTGFYDDDTIETWAKPYVSSALRSGVIQGTVSETGQIIFDGGNVITAAEAAVLLDRLLSVTDVSKETWTGSISTVPTWASQAVMNLETVGILSCDAEGTPVLSDQLTRAEAATMLAGAIEVSESRTTTSWFS